MRVGPPCWAANRLSGAHPTPLPAAAYCIPIVYCGVAFVPLWMTGLPSFHDPDAAARVTHGLASIGLHDVAANWALPVYLLVIATVGILLDLVATVVAILVWRTAPAAAHDGPTRG